jgi:hypothetical protein
MKLTKILVTAGLAMGIAACGSDNNNSTAATPTPAPVVELGMGELRVTHASPDAPKVNVYVDGELALPDVDYKDSSGNLELTEGTISVEVRGLLPDGSELSVIGPVDIEINANVRTEVVAWDNLLVGGDVNIKAAVINNDIVDISQVQVSVLHAAPQVNDVDVYVTAPGDALSSVDPIDAGFGDFAGPLELMADTDYQVRITPDGSDTVVYDSGTLSFAAGTELMLVAVENTLMIGSNPVNLLAVTATGASEVLSTGTGAQVRVVHNSADTPAVDILVNGGLALDAVPFPAASLHADIEAPAGTYTVVVAADADNTIAPISEELTLEAGSSYTVVAVGGLNGVTDETLEAVLTVDQRRSIATEASLRVIHGSYAVAETIPVDVYLSADSDITDATAAIENLAYREATAQIPVASGDYYVTVTAAGDKSVFAFAAGPLSLEAGTHYTVIARDPTAMEVGAPLILSTILTH